MANLKDKTFFKEWLEKLQQESWQLELLISGLALFGIYESRFLINELSLYSDANHTGLVSDLFGFLESVLTMGWYIFFFNLLIHVVLRGLWIGAIGLRYVSEDIDYDELKYSTRFTELLKKRVGDFDDFIEKLERICSVLFAYTFLLFLLFFSFMLFFFEFAILAELGSWLFGDNQLFILPALFFFFIGLVVFIDFISLGLFKKVEEPSISKVFVIVFKFYSFVTLSFLYAPILYNFLDNKYTRRLFFMTIPLFVCFFFLPKLIHTNYYNYYPSSRTLVKHGKKISNLFYDDLRKEYYSAHGNENRHKLSLPLISINKFMIDESYLKMYLKMEPNDAEQLARETGLTPFYEGGVKFSFMSKSKATDSLYLAISEPFSNEISKLRSERRVLRKQFKSNKDNLLNNQILNVETKIDSLIKQLAIEQEIFEEKKIENVIEATMLESELSIDGKDVRLLCDCYFHIHPNNDEKGLLCLYPMDSLAMGKHEIKYRKKRKRIKNNNQEVDRSFTQVIPFYKSRSFN